MRQRYQLMHTPTQPMLGTDWIGSFGRAKSSASRYAVAYDEAWRLREIAATVGYQQVDDRHNPVGPVVLFTLEDQQRLQAAFLAHAHAAAEQDR